MRELVYECKEPYEGSATIELPTYRERLKYVKECNFKIGEDSNIDASHDQVDSLIKMIDIGYKHIKKVNVKHIESGNTVKSLEEMENYKEFDALIPEICTLVLNGGQLGNV